MVQVPFFYLRWKKKVNQVNKVTMSEDIDGKKELEELQSHSFNGLLIFLIGPRRPKAIEMNLR